MFVWVHLCPYVLQTSWTKKLLFLSWGSVLEYRKYALFFLVISYQNLVSYEIFIYIISFQNLSDFYEEYVLDDEAPFICDVCIDIVGNEFKIFLTILLLFSYSLSRPYLICWSHIVHKNLLKGFMDNLIFLFLQMQWIWPNVSGAKSTIVAVKWSTTSPCLSWSPVSCAHRCSSTP